jgi:hypothetical protein
MTDLFVHLFVLPIVTFFEWAIDLLDEVDCIVLDTFLDIEFLLHGLPFALFVPDLPFFAMQAFFFSIHFVIMT